MSLNLKKMRDNITPVGKHVQERLSGLPKPSWNCRVKSQIQTSLSKGHMICTTLSSVLFGRYPLFAGSKEGGASCPAAGWKEDSPSGYRLACPKLKLVSCRTQTGLENRFTLQAADLRQPSQKEFTPL